MNNDDPLDKEVDFSKGVRGKFYRNGMKLRIPVYLEEKLLGSLGEIAQRKGMKLDDLVSDVLKKELAIVETLR
jgi:hypothetical protein